MSPRFGENGRSLINEESPNMAGSEGGTIVALAVYHFGKMRLMTAARMLTDKKLVRIVLRHLMRTYR
jgi:hypothetical protein